MGFICLIFRNLGAMSVGGWLSFCVWAFFGLLDFFVFGADAIEEDMVRPVGGALGNEVTATAAERHA